MKVPFFRKKSLYFRLLFIRITALMAVVIVLLSLFLYFNFRNNSLQVINNSNERLLSELGNNSVQKDNYIKIYSHALATNAKAVELMVSENMPLVDTLNSMKFFNSALYTAPFIFSLYFYNGTTNTIFTSGRNPIIRKKEDFYDKGIFEMLDNISGHNFSQPFARRIPPSNNLYGESADVYTYIVPNISPKEQKINYAVIINVKIDWLFSVLSSSDNTISNETDFLVLNDEGTVLGDSKNELFLENAIDIPYINNIYKSNKSSGYFLANVNGQKSVVTYVNIASEKWKLLSITPYKNVSKPIDKVQLITLIICSLILLFGFLFSYILSRNLYSPVGQLYNEVEQKLGKHTEVGKTSDEFEIILKNISNTHSKLRTLQDFKDSNINLLKQKYLQSILLNELKVKDLSFMESPHYNMQIDNESDLGVLVFRIDNYLKTFSSMTKSDQSIYKFALANITGEIISRQFKCEVVDMGGDHLAIIFNTEKDMLPDPSFIHRIKTLVKEIYNVYMKFCGISFTTGIGNEFESMNHLHLAYKKALEISNYRLCSGHGSILFYGELENSQTKELDISNSDIDNLLEELKKARLTDVENSFSSILSKLYEYKYENIMFTLHHLSLSIFNTLRIMEKNNIVTFYADFISFNNRINQLETMEEIRLEFMGLFKSIIQSIIDSKDDKSSFVVENIVKYIETHYTDPNLSTGVIASAFNLTPAYTGKIFREHTYKSIANYITEVRLNKAKELLINTSLNIDEIMEKIQWENKKYFFTIFKKHFGATPTQFRLKNIVEDINIGEESP